jgi:hypothetical protein
MINCGIGSWGDLFGADIHGAVYGTYSEGENYSIYANGIVYKNDLDVHLQKQYNKGQTVLYTNVSTDVTVMTSGIGQMENGKCRIDFDENFKNVVSDIVPVIVTITPIGRSEGIYLTDVTREGFGVEEEGEARSNVQFSFIAIGRRAGYEEPQLAKEVISPDYEDKLARGLHNDGDTGIDGEGLYYENGELFVGAHPSTLSDPARKASIEDEDLNREILEVEPQEEIAPIKNEGPDTNEKQKSERMNPDIDCMLVPTSKEEMVPVKDVLEDK